MASGVEDHAARPVRRVVFHPAVALVLGVLLLGDIWYWGNYRHRHVALLAAPCCVLHMGRSVTPRFPRTLIVDRDGEISIVDIYSDEGWAMLEADPRPPELRGRAIAFPMEDSFGLLAPVFTSRSHWFGAGSDDPARPLTDAEFAEARARFCEFLQTWNGGYLAGTGYIEALAEGDGKLERFHWLAALHDTAAVVALIVIVGGARRFARERRERRRRIAIEREHLCPRCGYDITAIRERCPECGEDITRSTKGMAQVDRPSDPPP